MMVKVLNKISIFEDVNRHDLPVLFLSAEKLGENLCMTKNPVYCLYRTDSLPHYLKFGIFVI